MRLLFTVNETAEILTAWELRHGGKPVSPRRVRYLIAMGVLGAHKPYTRILVRLNLEALQAA